MTQTSTLKKSDPKLEQLAQYLTDNGFSGNIPINEGAKNWRAIRELIHREEFYTFGIDKIKRRLKAKELSANLVRDILIAASGLDLKRFNFKGAGYFDPAKSATALAITMQQLKIAASAGQTILFATGHPGAMVGFLEELAGYARKLGAKIVSIDQAIHVNDIYYLDRLGSVLVPSDACSAWHSHETSYMEKFLELNPDLEIDLVVGDHGFVGASLNHNIACIGFYDTDDPAMPLAQHLGLPVLAVPINDNRFNADSGALGRYLISNFG